VNRKLVLGLIFILLAVLSGYIVYQTSPAGAGQISRVYSGYLVCQSCAAGIHGMAADGANVLKNPELHTVSCLKMPGCAASGFGIFMKTQDGPYTYYKFDKKGSDIAFKDIVSKTTKKDHLLVDVTGKLQNQTITVDRIVEK
jgi:hypothetical protein